MRLKIKNEKKQQFLSLPLEMDTIFEGTKFSLLFRKK